MEELKTHAFIRCMEREYAEQFIKNGVVKFGLPKDWVDKALADGDKRVGDELEGVFAGEPILAARPFVNASNQLKKVTYGGFNYYRNEELLLVPTLCLYGIHNNSFVRKNVKVRNHIQDIGEIDLNYFMDFNRVKTKNEYNLLPPNRQMVVIMISRPEIFVERLRKAALDFGFTNDEIFMAPVSYVDKKKQFHLKVKCPYELFFKDLNYKNQCECRIVLYSKRKDILAKFKKNGYCLELGKLDDISLLQSAYFEKMIYARQDDKKLLYTLSEPIETDLNDMSFEELLKVTIVGLCYQLRMKRASVQEYIDAINSLNEVFEKFNVRLSYEIDRREGKCEITPIFEGLTEEQNDVLCYSVEHLFDTLDEIMFEIG